MVILCDPSKKNRDTGIFVLFTFAEEYNLLEVGTIDALGRRSQKEKL